jgi:large subunit ribosomal protein L31
MKQNIHPTYYPEAKVKCACGKTMTVGATKQEIQVEICSSCHPFYTVQKKYIDTARRVEKFETRRKKATTTGKTKSKIKKIDKKKSK